MYSESHKERCNRSWGLFKQALDATLSFDKSSLYLEMAQYAAEVKDYVINGDIEPDWTNVERQLFLRGTWGV